MFKGTGCEAVENLTVSNRDVVHVTGITGYIKQTSFRRVRKIAKPEYQLRHVCLLIFFSVSVCLSVCLAVCPPVLSSIHPHVSLRPTGRIFMKLIFQYF